MKKGKFFVGVLLIAVLVIASVFVSFAGEEDVSYTVTLNANGGSFDFEASGQTEVAVEVYTEDEITGYLALDGYASSRENAILFGWNTAVDGSGRAYSCFDKIWPENLTADCTLYAQWVETELENPIVFATQSGDKGIFTGSVSGYDICIFDGDKAITAPDAKKDGYIFAGWMAGEAAFEDSADPSMRTWLDAGEIIAAGELPSEIYFAQWWQSETKSFLIVADGNGCDNQPAHLKSVAKIGPNSEADSCSLAPNCIFEKTGYVQTGWNTQKDGNGESYSSGETVAVPAAAGVLKLYAQWEECNLPEHYIVLCNYGGSIEGADSDFLVLNRDEATLLPQISEGGFFGWSTGIEKNGWSSETALFPLGGEVPPYNCYLYGVCSEDTQGFVSLFWNRYSAVSDDLITTDWPSWGEGGGSIVTETVRSVENSISRPGYILTGWNTKPDGSGTSFAKGAFAYGGENTQMSLYAQWRRVRSSGGEVKVLPQENAFEKEVKELCKGLKPVEEGLRFIDVSETNWAFSAIEFASEYGLLMGNEKGEFQGDVPMTKAMFMAVLARLRKVTVQGPAWEETATAWAVAQQISDGSLCREAIRREQVAIMLHRFFGSPKGDGASEAMAWAVENHILQGDDAGQLMPQKVASRAEIAQILKNLLERGM